ncbi:acyltransferase family protein [Almyronema epifaneia]|uniref:Acyltransferase family protein n=1 Tax=Almyronema epifaneia S1 TaxID=2991925 RepID=A0ABW6IGW8_9CYAN
MLNTIRLKRVQDRVKVFNLVSDRPASHTWLPSLEGLRAIAVILVFLEHTTGNVFRNDTLESGAFFGPFLNFGDAGMGRSGVYLFFVLSSFLLTNQLLRPHVEFKNPSLWLHYGFKRFTRIYPLYIFVLLIYCLFPSFKYDFGDVLSHLALQTAGNHFWTIPVEVKYYFLLPGIAWLISRVLNRSLILTAALSLGLMLFSHLAEVGLGAPARLSVLPHLSVFLVGSLAALVHIKLSDTSQTQQPYRKVVMEVIAILALLGIALSWQTQPMHLTWHWILHSEMPVILGTHWLYKIHGCLWAIVLVSHLHGQGWLSKILTWKPLRYIGVISFGIYLWHIAILGYLNAHLATSSMVKMLAIAAVTVIVATLTYITIERPAMQLKLPFLSSAALARK